MFQLRNVQYFLGCMLALCLWTDKVDAADFNLQSDSVPEYYQFINTLVTAQAELALEEIHASAEALVYSPSAIIEEMRDEALESYFSYLDLPYRDPRPEFLLNQIVTALDLALAGDLGGVYVALSHEAPPGEIDKKERDLIKDFLKRFICNDGGWLARMKCRISHLLTIIKCATTGGVGCLVSILGDAFFKAFCTAKPESKICNIFSVSGSSDPTMTTQSAPTLSMNGRGGRGLD